jgi:polar amino acid transport system substrate-binding protein
MMKRILFFLLTILAVPVPAQAANLIMAVGRSLPPYVFIDEWRGLEYDVVREALELEGHTITPRFMAYARVIKELESGAVDAAMTMRPDTGVRAHYSDVHVTYRNYAITLAKRNLTIDSPADLGGKTVMAFQNATRYLGAEFKAMAANNPAYREEAKQAIQPTLLYLGRIDVAVADSTIFNWFANTPDVKAKADTSQALRLHPIFEPTDYHVAFRDPALRDSFNRGLRKLRESGQYATIVARYQ